MLNLKQHLVQKELELARLKRVVEAMRIVDHLLADDMDSTAKPAGPTRNVIEMHPPSLSLEFTVDLPADDHLLVEPDAELPADAPSRPISWRDVKNRNL
jgi:hypothetical protein